MKSMPMTLALLLLTGSAALSQNTAQNVIPGAPSVGVPRGVNPSNSQDLTNRGNSLRTARRVGFGCRACRDAPGDQVSSHNGLDSKARVSK